MTVQIFQDPADQCFVVVGSALDTRPDQVVQQIQSRCRPFSIKLVFIAPCTDPNLWLNQLASIGFYLKPNYELIGLSQPGAIYSKDLLTDRIDPASWMKFQRQMNNYNEMMQMLSHILNMQHETRKNIIANVRA